LNGHSWTVTGHQRYKYSDYDDLMQGQSWIYCTTFRNV